MHGTPEISILIAAYNAADTLGEQLDSLRPQQYEGSWEVLVADNRSSDGAAERVRRYQQLMPNLRLIDHRGTLHNLWHQVNKYALDYPLLYKSYKAHGMPRASARQVVAKYWWLLNKAYFPLRGGPGRRAKWLYEAAYAWGLMRGSLRHRQLYL